MSLNLMAIGDSKTVGLFCCVATNGYRDGLLRRLKDHSQENDVEFSGVLAASEKTTAATLADLPAFIAEQVQTPTHVLINLGTNDLSRIRAGSVTEASWKSDMGDILDAIHATWPTARIFLMRPIWVGYEVEAAALNDDWMPEVLAPRSSFAFVGPDEREWLPALSDDGIHPNIAGTDRTAAEWQAVMGY